MEAPVLGQRVMTALAAISPPVIGNVEAEACLLGAMMETNGIIDGIADKLTPEDFAEALHGRIFSAIVRERSLGRIANPVTLKTYFVDDPAIQELGGVGYLGVLTGGATFGANDLAEQVAELAKRRRLIDGLAETLATLRDYETPLADIVAGVETTLSETMNEADSTELSAADCVGKAISSIDSHNPGVLSGIPSIDEALGPIRRKNLVIVAARPGMGKTIIGASIARGAAEQGKGVLFVSLEMADEELGERIASDMSYDEESGTGVPYDAIVNGRVGRDQMRWLLETQEQLGKIPLQVVDIGALKISQLSTMVRRWKRKFAAKGQSLELVVVDYLQLLSPDYRVSGPYEAITLISKGLKAIAKTQDVGVLALAQLSRKVEERADKKPQLSDLRDSGQIEQDADAVLFLLRQEYYMRAAEPHPGHPDRAAWETALDACRGKIEYICAKRRKGSTRTTEGRFYGAYQAVRG